MLTPASFAGLEIIAAVAFVIPLLLDVLRLRLLPAVVLEILAGIIIGPYGLHWVSVNLPIEVFSLIGLSFLLFLAGLEVDLTRLRGQLLRVTASSFALSCGVAFVVALVLRLVGLVSAPLFIAIVLVASTIGVILPTLKATGRSGDNFGQLVIAGASLGEFGAILAMSIFFSSVEVGALLRVALLGLLALLAVGVYAIVLRAERSARLTRLLVRLEDSTAQVRVRGAWVVLAAFVVLAQSLGLAAILGAFIAGVLTRLIDPDAETGHPQFRMKLEAVGYAVFVPTFFIATGLQFDVPALFSGPATLALIPVFLGALLVVHCAPLIFYRQLLNRREAMAAGLLQAATLTFVLASAQIGESLHLINAATGAALTATALISIVLFPLGAISLLRRAASSSLASPDSPRATAEARSLGT